MAQRRMRLAADDRRTQILRSAVRVFARSNYRAATVAEIAAEAGISEALIYRFFASKGAMFLEILRHMSERILGFWRDEQDREADAIRALRGMAVGYHRRMTRHPDELRVQFQAVSEVGDPAIADQLRRDHQDYMRSISAVLARGIRQGTIRGDVDVEVLAFLFNGVGILMNMMKLLGFDREFSEARVDLLVDHLLESIRPVPARGRPAGRRQAATGRKP